MDKFTPNSLDKTWHFSEHSICSLYQSAINFEYSFNTDIAYVKKCFKDNYKPILIKERLDYSLISNAENFFITSFSLNSFDEGYLKPDLLIKFCKYISINQKLFYDNYYKFVFSSYDKTILNWRNSNNLSQKQAAKLLQVSPVSICSWERLLTYPSRYQFNLLINNRIISL